MFLLREDSHIPKIIFENDSDLFKEESILIFSNSSNTSNIEIWLTTSIDGNNINVSSNTLTTILKTNETKFNYISIGTLTANDSILFLNSTRNSNTYNIPICSIMQGDSNTANDVLISTQNSLIDKLHENSYTNFVRISTDEDGNECFVEINLEDEPNNDNYSYKFQDKINGVFVYCNNKTELVSAYDIHKQEILKYFNIDRYNYIDNVLYLIPPPLIMDLTKPQPKTDGLETI